VQLQVIADNICYYMEEPLAAVNAALERDGRGGVGPNPTLIAPWLWCE
jgi:hypothetical protein